MDDETTTIQVYRADQAFLERQQRASSGASGKWIPMRDVVHALIESVMEWEQSGGEA